MKITWGEIPNLSAKQDVGNISNKIPPETICIFRILPVAEIAETKGDPKRQLIRQSIKINTAKILVRGGTVVSQSDRISDILIIKGNATIQTKKQENLRPLKTSCCISSMWLEAYDLVICGFNAV